ncbi:copper amine oxidase N-terminal domain-containing protein [Paenibacillus sp. N1-5-1-14]|uniref:copper amine oxidase N-terminal domain-containing protein n=1 Tax=Paenibacillus radicibacter TaxID=2972488 RepID=UPI0021599406|nr:copper amine oxidase N-terminal domain-containing protein [Paenibacillus radicibacter]MCR8642969.1 copper amine oxidase N-terminal domain-containing protein [Paenibacillus radicibacter]
MKKVLIGVVIGSAVTLTTSAYADTIKEYILTKIDYPILVNGKEFKSNELPALNYQGNTYLPLKAIGEALGKPVKWNDQLYRVEIGQATEELTPQQQAEQYKKDQDAKVQKLIDNYKAKGIELINLLKFEIFMSTKSNYLVDSNSKNYQLASGYRILNDGKTYVNYLSYKGVMYDYTVGVEVIEPDDIPAYIGNFVDMAYLKKFIPQNILDEYFKADKNKTWGINW